MKNILTAKYSLIQIFFMAVSTCIGAGIFIIATNIHSELNSNGIGSMVTIGYIIGAFPAIASAYICGICSSIWPSCGGDYTYYKRSFNNIVGYVVTWCSWIASPFQIQGSAITCVVSFSLALDVLGFQNAALQLNKFNIPFAILLLIIGFIINFFRIEGFVAPITAFLTVAFGIIIIKFSFSHNQGDFFTLIGTNKIDSYGYLLSKPDSIGLIMGTAILIFAYGGITFGQNAGEECKNSFNSGYAKTVIFGVLFVIVFYCLISYSLYKSVPWQYIAYNSMQDHNFSIVKAISIYIPKGFIAIMYFLLGISILDNMFIIAFRSSRQGFAFARDDIFPKIFNRTIFGGPGYMVIFIYLIAFLFLLWFHYANLALIANYSYCLGFIFTGIVGLSLTDEEIRKISNNVIRCKFIVKVASIISIIIYSILLVVLSVVMIKMTIIWILLAIIGVIIYFIKPIFRKFEVLKKDSVDAS